VPILVRGWSSEGAKVFKDFDLVGKDSAIYRHFFFNAVATQLGSLIQRKQAEKNCCRIAQEICNNCRKCDCRHFQSTPSGGYISANPALWMTQWLRLRKELMSDIKIFLSNCTLTRNAASNSWLLTGNNAVSGVWIMVCRRDRLQFGWKIGLFEILQRLGCSTKRC